MGNQWLGYLWVHQEDIGKTFQEQELELLTLKKDTKTILAEQTKNIDQELMEKHPVEDIPQFSRDNYSQPSDLGYPSFKRIMFFVVWMLTHLFSNLFLSLFCFLNLESVLKVLIWVCLVPNSN